MDSKQTNNVIHLAQGGQSKAIAQLLNVALRPQGIVARITGSNDRLTIFAEGQALPNQESLIGILERGFKDLEIDTIVSVKVFGKSAIGPEDGWSHEIVFLDESPNEGAKRKGLNWVAIKKRALGFLSELWSRIRRLFRNKRFVIGAITLTTVGLLASGSVAGFNVVRAHSTHSKTISEAKTLTAEAQAKANDSVEQLRAKLTQLRTARQLLRSIPASQSGLHKKAQQELGITAKSIESIETKLSDVKSITDKLSAADSVVKDALSEVNQPPYSIEDWNKAKNEVAQGIMMAESIPQYGISADQVKRQTEEYREKLSWIEKAIANEQAGVAELSKANQLAQEAYNFTNGRSKFAVSDLEKARDLWKKAIDQVKTVPPTTDAYRAVSAQIDLYTENYNEIVDGIYEVNSCSVRNSGSEYLSDYCHSVYLYLNNPSDS